MDDAEVKKSFLVPFIKATINLTCQISPYQIVSRLIYPHHEEIPFWFLESYILIRLLIVSIWFSLLQDAGSVSCYVLSVICILMLCDLLAGNAKILLIEREERSDEQGHYILVRDVSRWLILVFINLGEIALYFSVLYFWLGDGFCLPIDDRLTALYQSLLTFTTLGYGEISPRSSGAKMLVILNLVYFMIFVFLVVPVVLSVVRAKEHTKETLGKPNRKNDNKQTIDKQKNGDSHGSD